MSILITNILIKMSMYNRVFVKIVCFDFLICQKIEFNSLTPKDLITILLNSNEMK